MDRLGLHGVPSIKVRSLEDEQDSEDDRLAAMDSAPGSEATSQAGDCAVTPEEELAALRADEQSLEKALAETRRRIRTLSR